MNKTYMLAGTPGVGKTSVGIRVAQVMDLELIEVAELAGGLTEIDARALSARAGARLRKTNRGAVIATHIAFKPRGFEVAAVAILRRDPFELLHELSSRGYPENKCLANVEAELLGVVYSDFTRMYGRERVRQIDVTKRALIETVEIVRRCFSCEYVSEEVDWFSRLEGNGRLDELLSLLSRRSGGL